MGRALDVWGWTPTVTVLATGATAFLVAAGWLVLMGLSPLTAISAEPPPDKPLGEPDAA